MTKHGQHAILFSVSYYIIFCIRRQAICCMSYKKPLPDHILLRTKAIINFNPRHFRHTKKWQRYHCLVASATEIFTKIIMILCFVKKLSGKAHDFNHGSMSILDSFHCHAFNLYAVSFLNFHTI